MHGTLSSKGFRVLDEDVHGEAFRVEGSRISRVCASEGQRVCEVFGVHGFIEKRLIGNLVVVGDIRVYGGLHGFWGVLGGRFFSTDCTFPQGGFGV